MLKKIDEINFSMTNKFIDLIAFNETRLDPNITDNMISLDGYDVIRKDRSRNGGGVCIYSCIQEIRLRIKTLEIIENKTQQQTLPSRLTLV